MTTTAAPAQQPVATARIPRTVRALIGLLAATAAIGSGQLVAALVAPASAPFFAVADTVIRLSPPWLTEFGKSLGPVLDKLLLQVGVAVAVAAVAALAGIVSRRGPGPGLAIIGGLGLAGLAAVVAAPAFGLADLVAPIVAAAVGLAVFALLHGLARTARAGRPTGAGVPRRALLIGASAAVGAVSLGAWTGGLLLAGGTGIEDSRRALTARLAAARLTERAPAIPDGAAFPELGTPTFLTPNPAFYRIDTALRIPSTTAAAWRMRVHGMVERELTLTVDDLLARPLVERTVTMTCVSNPVGGDLVSTANFVGVDLREIFLDAGVRPGADQVFSTSLDGWYTGTPTDVVMEPDRGAMLALGMNGEALPPEHGFPVRMLVPGLYGFVSATKWLADIELTTFGAKQGYWLERRWAQRAPIKTQCRIDFPRGFATVAAGRVMVAGIAWAQPSGISRVEVRMDGSPWREATLSTEVNGRTWRMWKAEFDLSPGNHTVQTRATDMAGTTQPETRAEPIPDGASGWPATIFTAA
ncbi:molybdopterin-dependent oxidoreductase [Pseudonocardia sp. TRM90224]|uniref:molybdopterin-dependent oxidoreductase n=1 Tax=Pseudonocardia sp. TRM90224 TaxID=2812678 RepID=UPI001E4B530B|nr:molybdopterin-dependent oxidoreductase [Pseudonocardia sp. TRM90224]